MRRADRVARWTFPDFRYPPRVTEIERVLRALEAAGVRYLVVGGVAVVLHGHPRFTADLDLAVALEPANVRAAFAALATLGYHPRVPVSAEMLSDPEARRRLVVEKGMTVLSFASPDLPTTEVDVFADPPFAFDETYQRATRVDLGDVAVRVASIRDVIAMKRRVGRPKDLEDVAMRRATGASCSMGNDAPSQADPPPLDGWSAHEEAQRRAWQRTTARDRLAWLEDAKRFAAKAQHSLRSRCTGTRGGTTDSSR